MSLLHPISGRTNPNPLACLPRCAGASGAFTEMPCPAQELWEAGPPAFSTCGHRVIGLASRWPCISLTVQALTLSRQSRISAFVSYSRRAGHPGTCSKVGASVQCGRQRCRHALPLTAPAGCRTKAKARMGRCLWREPWRKCASDRQPNSGLQERDCANGSRQWHLYFRTVRVNPQALPVACYCASAPLHHPAAT